MPSGNPAPAARRDAGVRGAAEAQGDPLAAMGARLLAGSPEPGRPGRGGDRPV